MIACRKSNVSVYFFLGKRKLLKTLNYELLSSMLSWNGNVCCSSTVFSIYKFHVLTLQV